MICPVLKSPRPLPRRYARPVTPRMRQLVAQRHKRHMQRRTMQWRRTAERIKRRFGSIRRMIIRFVSLVTAGLLLLGIALSLFSPILHIREVRIARSDPRIDAERVQLALAGVFGQHLFFLPVQQVKDTLAASVPDLAEAQIIKQYPSTLQIRLTLDPVIAKLEIGDPDARPTGTGAQAGTGQTVPRTTADYLTSKGVYAVYPPSQVAAASGLLLLRVVDWGAAPEPWKQLADPEFLERMKEAEAKLKSEFNVPVSIRALYLRAREFHLQTPRYSLWFDTRSPISGQLDRYRLFLESVGQEAATVYVDLRLKDKIVYR